jgi:hypothetical protein
MVPTQVDTMTMRRMSKRRARTQLHRRWKQDRRHALLVRYCGGRKGGHNTPTQHQQAGMHQVTGAFPEEAAAAIQATMPQTQTDSGLGLRTPDSGLRTPGGRATGHGPAGRIASRTSGPETKASACTISEYAHAHWPPPGWPLSAVVIVISTPDASRHYVTYMVYRLSQRPYPRTNPVRYVQYECYETTAGSETRKLARVRPARCPA